MKRAVYLASLLLASCASTGVSTAVKQDLERTIANGRPTIEQCYKQTLEANAAAEGEIVLSFEVQEGKKEFTRVKVEKTTINEPDLEKCVVHETDALALSKAAEAKLAVTYPLQFKKNALEGQAPANDDSGAKEENAPAQEEVAQPAEAAPKSTTDPNEPSNPKEAK